MTQITVKVDDSQVRTTIDRAVLAVQTVPKKLIKAEMQKALDESRKYPAELPGQRYVRTGTYYRSFKLEPMQGQAYRLSSSAKYAKYVGGDAQGGSQAWFHVGRWPMIYDRVQDAMQRIVALAEEEFRRILSRGPGGL